MRSLLACFSSLQNRLSDQKCSISLLSKTWIVPSRSLSISQFRIYRSNRSDGYSGIVRVVHNSLKSKLIPIDINTKNKCTNHTIDILGIEIHFTDSYPSLNVWSCYIPSSSNVPSDLWRDLLNLVSYNTFLGSSMLFIRALTTFRCGSQIYEKILLIH